MLKDVINEVAADEAGPTGDQDLHLSLLEGPVIGDLVLPRVNPVFVWVLPVVGEGGAVDHIAWFGPHGLEPMNDLRWNAHQEGVLLPQEELIYLPLSGRVFPLIIEDKLDLPLNHGEEIALLMVVMSLISGLLFMVLMMLLTVITIRWH